MRELDRDQHPKTARAPALEASRSAGDSSTAQTTSIAIIGDGRAGKTFASGLRHASFDVSGPLARGEQPGGSFDIALICVPDAAIAEVAGEISDSVLVGHCSGASGPEILGRDRAFCIHPLMTLSGDPSALEGAWSAVDASDPHSLETATKLAQALGMNPFRLSPGDRTAYHAAASIASNFLITLQEAAHSLAKATGLPDRALVPLVKATVNNWEEYGAAALTGPIARGDVETVERQREAIAERAPELLELFDVLCDHTSDLNDRTRMTAGADR